MFFSLQIIWYPIEAVLALLSRVLRKRSSHNDTEAMERSSHLRSDSVDSTATTFKQDLPYVKVVECPGAETSTFVR
ncbi:hypothetical protein N7490_002416 [Penicillium lividum]|nr:hypothetical protein N7490_002416 [Penicillium lividum]